MVIVYVRAAPVILNSPSLAEPKTLQNFHVEIVANVDLNNIDLYSSIQLLSKLHRQVWTKVNRYVVQN